MKVSGNYLLRLSFVSAFALLIFGSCADAVGPGEAAGVREPYGAEAYVDVVAPKPERDAVTVYSGYEFVEDSNFFYAGFIVAVNGDLSQPGFLVQGFGGFGDYEYLNSAVPGGKVNGDLTEFSGLLGYQFFSGNVRFRIFGGVDWQDNDLSPPDPMNPVSGDDTNVLVTGEVETVAPQPLYYQLFGSYTPTNETYWSRARIGYNFGKTIIGPEGTFYGNENFNSQRVGAFIKFPLVRRLDLTLAGGFNFVANDEFFEQLGSGSFGGLGGITDGGYGNISISTWF